MFVSTLYRIPWRRYTSLTLIDPIAEEAVSVSTLVASTHEECVPGGCFAVGTHIGGGAGQAVGVVTLDTLSSVCDVPGARSGATHAVVRG